MSFILRTQIIAIVFVFFIVSCKTELEKIDINNVEAHRAYQDRILKSDTTNQGYLSNIKKLIKDYSELEKNHLGNENLHYYFARLYNNVNALPFRGFWLDTISNKMVNEADYINFYDSSYYFSEKALEQNKNNIRAMFILCESFYYEKARQEINPDIKVPFSFYRNETLFGKRISYIINNALRFKDIDTTKGKYLSRGISEVALYILTLELGGSNYKYDSNNQNLVNKYFILGELFDFVKGQEKVIYNFKEDDFEKKLLSNIHLARNELKRQQDIALEEQRKAEERELKLKNIRSYGSQYVGTWKSDDMSSKLIIKNDGTYEVYYYGLGGSEGKGKWDCTAKSISFTKTSGDHVAFMFEAVYHSNTAVFEYYNIFAPTLCLNRSDGHVDFCYSHHNQ